MKRLLVLAAVVLGGCTGLRSNTAPAQAAPVVSAPPPAVANGGGIERIPFRLGVSSATVEAMAKQQACTGGPGAGLVAGEGPVEVYRMQCASGKVFMARCELRQCRKM